MSNGQETTGRRLHPPAMVDEVLEFLRCRNLADEKDALFRKDAVFIDGTLGTGGHTLALLKAHPTCRVVAFDRDKDSQAFALQRISDEGFAGRVTPINCDFREAPEALHPFFENQKVGADGQPIQRIDGALVDAGMSLFQISWGERGLSFQKDGPLDMRYDRTQGPSAYDLVNGLSPTELEDLLFKLADERWARRIAEFIAATRNRSPIRTTSELAQVVENAIPAGVRHQSKVHPATKTFAALRLAVNDEFWALDQGSKALCSVLAPSARLVVLTYSSNEDRTIKRTFRRLAGRAQGNESDQSKPRPRKRVAFSQRPHEAGAMRSSLAQLFPIGEKSNKNPLELPFDKADSPDFFESSVSPRYGVFGQTWMGKIITSRPVVPQDAEIALNPLSRSCKLRAIERVEIEEKPGSNRNFSNEDFDDENEGD